MKRIAVIYHFLPHYRLAIFKELDDSIIFDYTFYADDRNFDGIITIDKAKLKKVINAPFILYGGLYWQKSILLLGFSKQYDAAIFLGNPNFVSTWFSALLFRLNGKKVFFWTHGWLKPEGYIKRHLRNIFYRLANKVFVYGNRAKDIGVKSGYPQHRIEVIYNSLDVDAANAVLNEIKKNENERNSIFHAFHNPDLPLIVCTARLTALCRFDLLLDAARILSDRRFPLNIILVGDGPERENLEKKAKENGNNVYFFGACYDENILGSIIYASDVTVSPGKIGLTAVHSLMYGTPIITHDDLNAQMPEVESLIDGVTGKFFKKNDVNDLADVIYNWLVKNKYNRSALRDACRKEIREKWSPENQRNLIESAIKLSFLKE